LTALLWYSCCRRAPSCPHLGCSWRILRRASGVFVVCLLSAVNDGAQRPEMRLWPGLVD
jgi:hypothetical protein